MGVNERRPIVWQNLLSDDDFLRAIAVQGSGVRGDANRVADALLQQNRHAGSGGHDALGSHTGFGQPQVQRVIWQRLLPVSL